MPEIVLHGSNLLRNVVVILFLFCKEHNNMSLFTSDKEEASWAPLHCLFNKLTFYLAAFIQIQVVQSKLYGK